MYNGMLNSKPNNGTEDECNGHDENAKIEYVWNDYREVRITIINT